MAATGAKPRPCRKATHAVAHQHRWHAGRGSDLRNGGIDDGHILVDGTEHRFEIHGGEAVPLHLQLAHPWVRETAIAHEAVDEDDATPSRHHSVDAIGQRAPAKRLAPAEDTRRGGGLAEPRTGQFAPGRPRRRIAAPREAQRRELGREEQRVRQHHDGKARHRERPRQAPEMRQPRARSNQQRQGDDLLHAGQGRAGRHPASITLGAPAASPQPGLGEARLDRLGP